MHYLYFLSSSPDLMQCHSWASSLFDINIKKQKTLETSLDVMPSFKASVNARVEGFVSNVDYLESAP